MKNLKGYSDSSSLLFKLLETEFQIDPAAFRIHMLDLDANSNGPSGVTKAEPY